LWSGQAGTVRPDHEPVCTRARNLQALLRESRPTRGEIAEGRRESARYCAQRVRPRTEETRIRVSRSGRPDYFLLVLLRLKQNAKGIRVQNKTRVPVLTLFDVYRYAIAHVCDRKQDVVLRTVTVVGLLDYILQVGAVLFLELICL